MSWKKALQPCFATKIVMIAHVVAVIAVIVAHAAIAMKQPHQPLKLLHLAKEKADA
jgi:uncharacterized protein (DUF927 family)